MDLAEALERFGMELPDVPEGFEHLWDWFWELASGRGSNGFGPLPLSWESMAAWAGIAGVPLAPWLARIFRRMDTAWLSEQAKQTSKTRQANGRNRAQHTPRR